jgi:hypothetical protein
MHRMVKYGKLQSESRKILATVKVVVIQAVKTFQVVFVEWADPLASTVVAPTSCQSAKSQSTIEE